MVVELFATTNCFEQIQTYWGSQSTTIDIATMTSNGIPEEVYQDEDDVPVTPSSQSESSESSTRGVSRGIRGEPGCIEFSVEQRILHISKIEQKWNFDGTK